MAKILNRWNWKTRAYEPHELPDSRKATVYVSDPDTLVDCASCGVSLPYGEAYVSCEIHTATGFGYAVCKDCYEEEIRREKEA